MADNSNPLTLQQQINYIELQTAPASVSNGFLAGVLNAINNQKVDKVAGKGLSTNDFTNLHKEVLDQVRPDWHGTQAQYNALTSRDATRWYFIEQDDEVVAIYRGDQLVTAIPNMVGEFHEDTTVDDWYWFPNGVKTALPVDPATKRFSFYYPAELNSVRWLFAESNTSTFVCRLKRLEKMPLISKNVTGDWSYMLLGKTNQCEVFPTIDCRNIGLSAANKTLNYCLLTNTACTQLHFANTSAITKWEMTTNLNQLLAVTGVDLSATTILSAKPFSTKTAFIEIKNLGKAQAAANFDLRTDNWGDDTKFPHSRQSLVDSLLTNSFNRAAAGYTSLTIQLSAATYARLTSAEVSAITAKGFTLVTA